MMDMHGIPRASRGPFSAVLVGMSSGNSLDPAAYRINVYGLDGEHVVFRRYSHFADLRAKLIESGLQGTAELPPLPPKSFFRKKFLKKFMLQRAACLRRFFQVALQADRFLTTVALSDFLAVGKPSTRQPVQTLMPVISYGGQEGLSYGGGMSYGGDQNKSYGGVAQLPGMSYGAPGSRGEKLETIFTAEGTGAGETQDGDGEDSASVPSHVAPPEAVPSPVAPPEAPADQDAPVKQRSRARMCMP